MSDRVTEQLDRIEREIAELDQRVSFLLRFRIRTLLEENEGDLETVARLLNTTVAHVEEILA